MRLIHVQVPDEQRDAVVEVLEERSIDYTVLDTEDGALVEFPLPTDGVGDVTSALEEAEVDTDSYTVIATAETAMTTHFEELQERYSDDFDPLTEPELRSKSRDISSDPKSFVWMIFLSAVIATAGLLVDSPAIVVGSMVIAPIVGPVLTAGVGAVTADREMFVKSIRLQLIGLAVAVGGAAAFAFFLRTFGFFPSNLDITSIELITVRIAPNFSSVVVGVAAGAAAAWGLTTKGPTSLIGVMIAAALIPAAATIGIAVVWGYQLIALGTTLLFVITLLAINLAVFVMLWYLGYRRVGFESGLFTADSALRTAALVVAAVVLVAGLGAVAVGTYQQVTYERTVSQEVHSVVNSPQYSDLNIITVRTEYTAGGVLEPATVTVTISRTSNESYPDLARTIRREVVEATPYEPAVRLRFVDFQEAS